MPTRTPFHGTFRKLVLAIDVGTTFSGVSYSILDPGEIPQTLGVRRYPGQEHAAGDSKIPSILYYDQSGQLRAVGAEVLLPNIVDQAFDEDWIRVEWFKLHLRPDSMITADDKNSRMTPLPPNKTIIDIFADFISYLYSCTKRFIMETHASGDLLWASVENHIDFIFSHPNGWGGAQQSKMRQAAIRAGLVPNTQEGNARIQFVTEGEASVHFCISNGLAAEAVKDGKTVMVVDAGGGTVDISTYSISCVGSGISMEEVAVPSCIFQGSAMVNFRLREFLMQQKLAGSRYGNAQDIEEMVKSFDKHAKPVFKNPDERSFIRFGSMRDRDPTYDIKNGQLALSGTDVEALFEPSVSAIEEAVHEQLLAAYESVSIVFLVGGFAASPWLFGRLNENIISHGLRFFRPDTHTNKAVAEGALSFYLDHFVSVRMARFTYGARCLAYFDASDPEHQRRSHRMITRASGRKCLPDSFLAILNQGTRVSEEQEFSRSLNIETFEPASLGVITTEITSYKGTFSDPRWTDTEPATFSTLCTVHADTSRVPKIPQQGPNGTYYSQDFKVILSFGLTELKAQLSWMEKGKEKRSVATTVYDDDVVVL